MWLYRVLYLPQLPLGRMMINQPVDIDGYRDALFSGSKNCYMSESNLQVQLAT
jgi:hypothetical protein